MESPQALIALLERGSGGFNKSSSDDRPGPGICTSKYVEDKRPRGASRFGAAPQYKKRESSDERLRTLPKNGSFLLSHLVWQYHRR